ncbi:MAG: hypothetical protein AB7L92_07400 [Alphaproteobacteria bacterium]
MVGISHGSIIALSQSIDGGLAVILVPVGAILFLVLVLISLVIWSWRGEKPPEIESRRPDLRSLSKLRNWLALLLCVDIAVFIGLVLSK